MNSVNGDAFFDDQNAAAADSESRRTEDIAQDHGSPTPNGMVSSHHGKDSNHHSKSKEGKKEHSKDKHREHKHKDHKHSKEHKSKENHVSSSKEHSSSKHHHHHKDEKSKEKSKDGSSKDKSADPSKPKHSSDKEKHRSKDEKHKSDKHKSTSEHSASDSKPKDPLKLVIKPKDGSVHSSDKHSSKHSSEKHSSSSSDKHKVKHSSDKHSSDKHSSDRHSSDKHSSDRHEKSKSDKIKSESSSKEKVKEEKQSKAIKEEKVKVKTEPLQIKTEPISMPLQIKTEPQNDEESPQPRQMVGMKSPSKLDKTVKRESEESDDEPLASRMEKVKKKKSDSSKKRKLDDDDFKPMKKTKVTKEKPKATKRPPAVAETSSPKKGKKQEEEQEVWKWWEEEKKEDGVKWKTLQHNGPVFAPDYVPLPKSVKFYYDGKHMVLSPEAEEVAGFYGRMLDHDYVTKDSFNNNFFKDWRKCMTDDEKHTIKDLSKCNFKEYDLYYKMKSEERKAMSKEEKQAIKKENEEMQAKYGFCIIDGHKQKIGNFKIEPPGLFRGRGEHPKMGMLKRRVVAKDIILNLGKEATAPTPPPGQKWKEVRHDNTVTWLACWTENILGSNKYIMLNPSSKLKGEKDWQKYELARKLKKHAAGIQKQYQDDWKSKEMRVRQRAVALYFIDKLALRAGNEKEEGETADTVGCCSLRVEHITLDNEKDGKECVVTFDFLGKDSIRYINSVPVEKRVFKNLKLFMENKQPGDDLFDRLNTSILNKYLNDLMDGLTAKVFRTYNASKTLQEQLDKLTEADMSIPEKMLAYNRANRAVAILCNHQRSVPKTFDKQMENLQTKIQEKEATIRDHKRDMKDLKNRDKALYEKKRKRLAQLQEQLQKLEVQATDKEENKQVALGTSKLNYLDPRISVAWCKKWNVPIEKIYNKTQRDKFLWAIEMATADYKF